MTNKPPKRRFTYQPMAAEDFRQALAELNMTMFAFGRLFGVQESRVKEFASGARPIPPWARTMCALLLNHPENIVVSRQSAAEMILRDEKYPEDGDYPYLNGGRSDD